MVKNPEAYQPQNVSNIIWAFASLANTPPDAFLTAVSDHVLKHITDYSAQARLPSHTIIF